MPESPTRPVRTTLGAVLLIGSLALSGCGGDDAEPDAKASASAKAAGEASAVDTLIGTGLDQLADNDLEGAEGTFTSVLALDADNVYAHYNLGYIAQQQGDVGTAVEQYDLALTADPAFAPALYNLAILTEDADLEAAIALYRRAIEAKPDDAASHMRLGFALQHLGRTEEGQRMLDKGIELDPAMADVEAPSYAK